MKKELTSLEKSLKFVKKSVNRTVLNRPYYDGEYLVATNSYILYARKEDMGDKVFSIPPCDRNFPDWKNAVFPDEKNYNKKKLTLNDKGKKYYLKKLKNIKKLTNSNNHITLYDNGSIEIKNKEDDIYFLSGTKTRKSVYINIDYFITCISIADYYVEIIFPKKKKEPLLINYLQGDITNEFALIMTLT